MTKLQPSDLARRINVACRSSRSGLALISIHTPRRPASAAAGEVSRLALLRRWFFARKPDAGFVLTGFPATLLQARVFDEWLEARNETLTAVFAVSGALGSVVAHYRSLGLFQEATPAIFR